MRSGVDLLGSERTSDGKPKKLAAAEVRRQESITALAGELHQGGVPEPVVDMLRRLVAEFVSERPRPLELSDGHELIGRVELRYVPGRVCDVVAGAEDVR